jgi:glucose/arabinose dehydrogenase
VKNRLEPASTIVLADVLAAAPNGLMAIALDPRFDHNGFIYAAYTAASGVRIARFRSAGDTLEDGTILMDGIEFSAERPAASLRFGPDAKLYVAFDDGTDPGGAGDAGGFNGKVLRLNPDATTPDDQPDGTPVYASQISSPRGLDWDSLGTLWIADQTANGQDGLQAVTQQSAHDLGGVAAARYVLPDGTGVSGIAVYDGDVIEAFRGNLLIAAGDGRAVMRFRFDAVNPLAIASTERLLGDIVGRIRAVGVAPWGTVYLCTDSAVVQLLPDASADRPRARRAWSDRR